MSNTNENLSIPAMMTPPTSTNVRLLVELEQQQQQQQQRQQSPEQAPQQQRLVLVGAGHAHLQVLKELYTNQYPDHWSVTLIDVQTSVGYYSSGLIPSKHLSKLPLNFLTQQQQQQQQKHASVKSNRSLDHYDSNDSKERLQQNTTDPISPRRTMPSSSSNYYHCELQSLVKTRQPQITFCQDGVMDVDFQKQLVYVLEESDPIPYTVISFDIGCTTKGYNDNNGESGWICGVEDYTIPIRPVSDLMQRIEQADSEIALNLTNPEQQYEVIDESYESDTVTSTSTDQEEIEEEEEEKHLIAPRQEQGRYNPVRIVVVGGGVSGIELSLSVVHRWRPLLGSLLHVTIITQEPTLLHPNHFRKDVTIGGLLRKINNIDSTTTNSAGQIELEQLLTDNHIDVLYDSRVKELLEHDCICDCMERFSTTTIRVPFTYCFWAIGAAPHDLVQVLHQTRGLAVTPNGWIEVNEYMQSTSHPNVFAVGECCAMTTTQTNNNGMEQLHYDDAILTRNVSRGVVSGIRAGPSLGRNLCTMLLHQQRQSCTKSSISIGTLSNAIPNSSDNNNNICSTYIQNSDMVTTEALTPYPSFPEDFLQFIDCDDDTTLGLISDGIVVLKGLWVSQLKEAMDRQFMDLFEFRHKLQQPPQSKTKQRNYEHEECNNSFECLLHNHKEQQTTKIQNLRNLPTPQAGAMLLQRTDTNVSYKETWKVLKYMAFNIEYRSEILEWILKTRKNDIESPTQPPAPYNHNYRQQQQQQQQHHSNGILV